MANIKRIKLTVMSETVDYGFEDLGNGLKQYCRSRALCYHEALDEYFVVSTFVPIEGGEETVKVSSWEKWSDFSSNTPLMKGENTTILMMANIKGFDFISWIK